MAQDVSAAWTAEEKDAYRSIAHSFLASWHKESTLGAVTFTIGVSLIGGDDIIGINPGTVGSPGIYRYFDESDYVMGLSWERGLNIPTGGLSMAMAEAKLDNTSGRFLPDYMGGISELSTAILPRRPVIINAGFNLDGVDQVIPQFSGVTDKTPKITVRDKMIDITAADYVDFFHNRYLDHEVMFTGLRTDEVYENLLVSMGLATSQYTLDTGINIIPFGIFDRGTKYSDIFHQLAEAENGHFYQDELGIFRFENRQHWDSSPYTEVQRIITTGQVIESEQIGEDHIINVVEVKGTVLQKQPEQQIFKLAAPIQVLNDTNVEYWITFENPVLELNSTFFYEAYVNEDGTGTEITSSVQIKSYDQFTKSIKITFYNTGADGYITDLVLYGRVVKNTSNVYVRSADDSSVTAYEERPLAIENDYIQNESWAKSYAQMILNDYSEPENLIRLTIRAIPELQQGALISWQGR